MKDNVAIIKCNRYNTALIYKLIKKSLKDINFDFNKLKNSRILLKPNILGPYESNKAITTHPTIIESICKILKENKCEILIGESSFKDTKLSFKKSGIQKVAKKYNIELLTFETSKLLKVKNAKAKILKEFYIPKIIFDVDYMINIPKMKTHVLTKFTGAIKNLYGLIPGAKKQELHFIANTEEKFCHLLLDIYTKVKNKICLNIMDAITTIQGQGPSTGGNLKKSNLILLSENAIALDIICCKIMGFKEHEVLTNKFAFKRKIYTGKPDIIGNLIVKNYKKPILKIKPTKLILRVVPSNIRRILVRQILPRPEVNTKKCKKCGNCVKACPSKAISLKQYPVFNRKKCIYCYCCYENCPYNAIKLVKPKLSTFFK